MKSFSILGTGWLGFALAKSLKDSFTVKVSIRDKQKEKQMIALGFTPYLLDETNLKNLNPLLDSDYVFINFPPSKSIDYLKFLENIYSNENIVKAKKIIFISSTSVYPNEQMIFKEDYKIESPLSKKVFEAEQIVLEKTDLIFRCSGLMGYDRIPGKYSQGKTLDSQDVKVNYVHRDDVIKAVKFSLENDLNGIFNLCAPFHPTRKEIYLFNALKYSFKKLIFENKKEYKNRIIDGSKIEGYGFEYIYPNPLEFKH